MRLGINYLFSHKNSVIDVIQGSKYTLIHSQLTFTCSKSTRETLEKGVKYGQS